MPADLPQHTLRTLYLRVPSIDWAALSLGNKAEFRLPLQGALGQWYVAPTPVVLYCATPNRTRTKLAVLVAHRVERLVDIAEDGGGLFREGFETYEDFRRYWRRRTRKPYDPAQQVEVFQIEAWSDVWRWRLGPTVLERLYCDYLR